MASDTLSNLTMLRRMEDMRTRKANFTSAELRALVQEISRRKNILFLKSCSNDTNEAKRKAWADIARRVNVANGGYVVRRAHEVKKKWMDMQTLVRRKLTAQKRGTKAPLGRVPSKFQQLQHQAITETDRQVLSLLSGLSRTRQAEDSGILVTHASDSIWTSNMAQDHVSADSEMRSVKTEPSDPEMEQQLVYQIDDLNPDSPTWRVEINELRESSAITDPTISTPVEEQESIVDGDAVDAECLLSDEVDAAAALLDSSINDDSGSDANAHNQSVGLDLLVYNQDQLQVEKERLCVEKRRLGLETRRLIIEEQRLEIERRRLELEENRFRLNDEQAHAQNSPKSITLTLSAAANPMPNQNA